MSVLVLPVLLGLAILGVLGWRVRAVLRSERDAPRGAAPGKGHHTLVSEYFSGGGGGGETTRYKVPKDPQAYARLFVPKDDRKG